ncbi:hypothetical protein B296_00034910, partial [Ensete ventricosum]
MTRRMSRATYKASSFESTPSFGLESLSSTNASKIGQMLIGPYSGGPMIVKVRLSWIN